MRAERIVGTFCTCTCVSTLFGWGMGAAVYTLKTQGWGHQSDWEAYTSKDASLGAMIGAAIPIFCCCLALLRTAVTWENPEGSRLSTNRNSLYVQLGDSQHRVMDVHEHELHSLNSGNDYSPYS